ncbi:MAG: SpoIID/LytB domain-containing protein [Synergistaceae bacterium]|jgi:stage II sporulation protein D|nr:SpoIID/LytB domain-containing protein [Synergistaceae bacterium]
MIQSGSKDYFRKNSLYIITALLSLLALLMCFAGRAGAVENFNVKIGVGVGVSSGRLLGNGLALTDAKGTKLKAQNGAQVVTDGQRLSVGGKKLVLPVTVTATNGLGWGETKYRGILRIISAQGGFTVVNELDLESYLRGILKIEMNPEWPQEALRAQAILARTYALKNRGRFASKGFDLDNTENSQLYRGVNAEDPRTDAAVSATKGQVLTWNGKAADIYYHSDSGGATADVSHVWGGNVPYLKPCQESVAYTSPYSTWQTSFTSVQASEIMRKMGRDVGSVAAIEVSLRDEYGRAVQLRVSGNKGTADIKAHSFRMAAGSSVIRSTNFNVANGTVVAGRSAAPQTMAAPAAPVTAPVRVESLAEMSSKTDHLIEMTKGEVFTKDEMFDMLMNPDKREYYLKLGLDRVAGRLGGTQAQPAPVPLPQPVPVPAQTASGLFVFVGKGWGHGVGLSQWGAKAMADQGAKCADILSHYFPGTKIAR